MPLLFALALLCLRFQVAKWREIIESLESTLSQTDEEKKVLKASLVAAMSDKDSLKVHPTSSSQPLSISDPSSSQTTPPDHLLAKNLQEMLLSTQPLHECALILLLIPCRFFLHRLGSEN